MSWNMLGAWLWEALVSIILVCIIFIYSLKSREGERFSREKEQRLHRDFYTDRKRGLSSEEGQQPGVRWVWEGFCVNSDQVRAHLHSTPDPGEGLGGAWWQVNVVWDRGMGGVSINPSESFPSEHKLVDLTHSSSQHILMEFPVWIESSSRGTWQRTSRTVSAFPRCKGTR